MDGTQFLWLWWFTAKNDHDNIITSSVRVDKNAPKVNKLSQFDKFFKLLVNFTISGTTLFNSA